MPKCPSCSAGPMPESIRSCGETNAPAERITSPSVRTVLRPPFSSYSTPVARPFSIRTRRALAPLPAARHFPRRNHRDAAAELRLRYGRVLGEVLRAAENLADPGGHFEDPVLVGRARLEEKDPGAELAGKSRCDDASGAATA